MVIVARTRALSVGGIPEAIRRVKAYERAGVDAIFLPPTKREEVEAIHAETSLPLLLGGILEEGVNDQFLVAHGVRFMSASSAPFWASVKAAYDTLKAIRDGKSRDELRPLLPSRELKAQVTRRARYAEWIKTFMS